MVQEIVIISSIAKSKKIRSGTIVTVSEKKVIMEKVNDIIGDFMLIINHRIV